MKGASKIEIEKQGFCVRVFVPVCDSAYPVVCVCVCVCVREGETSPVPYTEIIHLLMLSLGGMDKMITIEINCLFENDRSEVKQDAQQTN